MKRPARKLELEATTIRVLTNEELTQPAGGRLRPPITWACPQSPLTK